jgi:NADPH:quinone reductase-like Zn-dependent oxidoreductase
MLEVLATCLRLHEKAATAEAVKPAIETRTLSRGPKDVLVEIKAAAVNPSDVKAAIGMMPYAVFPRTPGRDYAGVVISGPVKMIGWEVFGSSGDLGIRRDGTHATHLVVEAEAVVPFVTAIEGFRRAGMPKAGDHVLIMGINGKVGQAAAQIASWCGANVIGVVRRAEAYAGHASAPVHVVDSSEVNVAEAVRALTDGRGADIVFNTVGDPYYQDAHQSTAKLGRQILIAAVNKIVQFNIFEFYRGRHSYYGIDTLALSSVETGEVLRSLEPGFASGHLRPFPIMPGAVYALRDAAKAYVAVLSSSRDRVIFDPAI